MLRTMVGGWQLGGIYTFQSGAPIGWGNIFFRGDINTIKLSSNRQSPTTGWFNVDAGFERNASLQPASNVRTFPTRFGFLRADTINNYDLSLVKNTQVAEGKEIQFKSEFLNALNHPLFAAPNTTPTAAAFGLIQTSNQANYPRRIQLSLKFLF